MGLFIVGTLVSGVLVFIISFFKTQEDVFRKTTIFLVTFVTMIFTAFFLAIAVSFISDDNSKYAIVEKTISEVTETKEGELLYNEGDKYYFVKNTTFDKIITNSFNFRVETTRWFSPRNFFTFNRTKFSRTLYIPA